jgi:hypothetical protein
VCVCVCVCVYLHVYVSGLHHGGAVIPLTNELQMAINFNL